MHADAFWCTLMHFDEFSHMHQNACRMNCAKFLSTKLLKKWFLFLLDAQNESKCVRMHQNVCRMNCKNVCAENYNKSAFVTFEWAKIGILAPKIAQLLLNAQNASICIRIHQNVCRMNCAKVLCTKLSKNWFLLHLKGQKLTKYISHFMVVHPVVWIGDQGKATPNPIVY